MTLRLCLLFLLVPSLLHAEIVDRIAAIVGNSVITSSEIMEEANYRAYINSQPPVDDARMRDISFIAAVQDRLIEQTLLAEAQKGFPQASFGDESQFEQSLQKLRSRFPSSEALHSDLARYALTEEHMIAHLREEQAIMAFVDFRLRPQVRLTEDQLQVYYQQTLLPQLRSEGQATLPPFDDVKAEITRVLTEQEINRLLDEWLKNLRSSASIKILE